MQAPDTPKRATATPGIPYPVDVWMLVEVDGVESPLTAIPPHEQATFPFRLPRWGLLKLLFTGRWIEITVAVIEIGERPEPETES